MKTQFIETIETDLEPLIYWYEKIISKPVEEIKLKNTPKFKADCLMSYKVDGPNVQIEYAFSNIKPI